MNKYLCISLILLFQYSVSAQQQTIFSNKKMPGTLSDRWEIGSDKQKGTFIITPYKPMFITAGRWSDHPNDKPYSENPNYTQPYDLNYNNYEAKFQISMKVKFLQGIFKNNGDLWVGYTQKSHWQIYNTDLSRPFRETNYEPELILNFATDFSILGLRSKMVGIAFNHQSNGRGLPLSRSWNRVVAHAAFEVRKWTATLRGWYRLPDEEDENPAIADYIGRGDLVVSYKAGLHLLSLNAGHSLRFGKDNNHGFIQLDWSFPVFGNLRGLVQASHGYGETMIDYNNRQTLIGVSMSLVDWL